MACLKCHYEEQRNAALIDIIIRIGQLTNDRTYVHVNRILAETNKINEVQP